MYAGLLSLVTNKPKELEGKRALLFSYGSGLAATMFSVNFKGSPAKIAETADVKNRLSRRRQLTPEAFTAKLEDREKTVTAVDYEPKDDIKSLDKGTYFLKHIDEKERRVYGRRSFSTARVVDDAAATASDLAGHLASAVRPVPPSARIATALLGYMRPLKRLVK